MIPPAVMAQTNYYSKNGTEYAVVGSLPGDQVFPDAAVTPAGGFVVWQDNSTDGNGWGVSARRLDSTLSGTLGAFRVNQQGTNDQENPRVALLKNGGAVFVWQGGKKGYQHIFARFLTPTNTFLTTTDLVVSTFTNNFQINPAVATLNNSNVVVVWASFNQAGSNSLQDVYCKILSRTGTTVSNQFRINQFTNYNQRTPAVAALKNGGFVVGWVSEQQRVVAPNLGANSTYSTASALVVPSVDIYARLYASNGVPAGSEFLVNTDSNPCANPAVASVSDGSFMVTWGARDMLNQTNSFDIYARTFSSSGTGGTTLRVNSHLIGDQYAPRISVIAADYMIAWTSLGQDGSREGLFGQFVHNNGSPVGGEFQVNTTTVSQQMHPALTSDGAGQFLAVWTGYAGSPNSFDLFAQRYLNVAALLQPMAAPFVYAPFTLDADGVYQPQLEVSWPPLLGISVSNYEVYVDGSGVPAGVTAGNIWTMTVTNGLAASSTHSFQVDYVTTGGAISPISPATSGTTWGGGNYYDVPVEWLELYYGNTIASWPANVNAPLASGGLTLRQVFLSGGNPLDPGTWLRTSLANTSQGMFLSWNTQPGQTYQVQAASNMAAWSNLGSPRFAAGTNDSIFVGGGAAGYYRVLLLRQ
ncbi:MAG: hypothetical protein PHY43_03535 [Verrucomicrobiales bacterium]|nr:hypothetical protein [Verrucomicrobiales bacterium]